MEGLPPKKVWLTLRSMAGKPNKSKPRNPRRTRAPGPKNSGSNVTSKSSYGRGGRQAPRQNHPPETHFVFAEPNDLRVLLHPKHAAHIRQLLIRYFDNGGGSLDFQSGKISFAANFSGPKGLVDAIVRATSSQ
uniref:ORF9 n=1 Tax=Simian hemorrhagic fever virus TaxID=38143 RepID=L0CQB1_SHFV|nr:ORF9 [Simian hemorrhagic fever virus]